MKLVVVPLLEEVPTLKSSSTASPWACGLARRRGSIRSTTIVAKRQGDIDAILLEYGVPLIGEDNKPITAPRKSSTN